MLELVSNLSLLVLIIVTIVNFLLTIVVYKGDSKSYTNRIFSILGINLTIWAIAQYVSLQPFESQTSLFWVRFSTFWAVPITPLFFLLIHTLPLKNITLNKWKLAVLLILTLIVMLITISPYAFTKVEIRNGFVTPTPGPAIMVFTLFIVVTSISLTYTFISRLKKLQGAQKLQLIFVGIGILLMLGLMITAVVIPVTVFQNAILVPLFPLYTLSFTGIAAYAIVRHRLFDIRVIATEAITVILWIVLFAKLFVNKTLGENIMDALVLTITVIFGILLIRSVIREIQQREKLQELTERLRELDKQKDEFLSVAAHELRSPLTAIKGYISMIIEGDTGEISDKAKSYLLDATSVTERLVRLVNNMLDVSRIEEGRIVYQIEKVNLVKAIQEVYFSFKIEAERKSLDFKLNVADGIKDLIYVDPDRIKEVIGNLASNAVKFTDEGRIKINVKNSKEGWIRVEVVDTGPGISKEEQVKLFQKFYRAESTEGKTMGTGLGLYITKLLVEKFGGKIGLESEVKKGSNFWLELPLIEKSHEA